MLIFIIPTSYPNPDNPVANSFIAEQVDALSKYENNKIVVLNVRKQPSKYLFKRIDVEVHEQTKDNVTVIYKNKKTFAEGKFILINQNGFDSDVKKLYKYAIKLYGVPNIIYAHFYSAAYSALKIARYDGVPVVTMEHSGQLMLKSLDIRSKIILKKVVNESYKYIATTDKLKENIIKHTKTIKNIDVIPNMVDSRFLFSMPSNEKFRFFSLSRFDYDKRLDLLVEAFCAAFNKDESVELIIGGDGKEFSNISKQIKNENRESQIKLIGRLNRENSIKSMSLCNAFVLPSRHETFGLVWREALCCGRPVITTNHGGFGSTDWKSDYGVMIPVDDLLALKNALLKMYKCYGDYDLKAISDENKNRYSPEVITKRIMKIFNEAVND